MDNKECSLSDHEHSFLFVTVTKGYEYYTVVKEGRKMRLNELDPGDKARVTGLDTMGSMRRRFLDIGLIAGTYVECVGRSPAGDPSAYLIRGAVIAIRANDGKDIIIERA